MPSRHLKPGGWFEIQEFCYVGACDDESCDGPYAFHDFISFLKQGMDNLGLEIHGILKSKSEMAQAGFESIKEKNYKCPIGPWAVELHECGHILRDVILQGVNGLSRKPFRDGLGWSDLRIELFLVDVRKSISEEVNGLPKHHAYYPFYNICGRKPLSG